MQFGSNAQIDASIDLEMRYLACRAATKAQLRCTFNILLQFSVIQYTDV